MQNITFKETEEIMWEEGLKYQKYCNISEIFENFPLLWTLLTIGSMQLYNILLENDKWPKVVKVV